MKNKVLLINFEDELINERRGPRIPIADMPTFLDSPNNVLKLDEIASNFSWIAKKFKQGNPA